MAQAGTTRVALIGSGFIADVHLLALRAMQGVQVVALCDTVLPRSKRLARRYGVPHVFGTVAELIAAKVCTAVHVLVPPGAHRAVAEQCLAAGLHVLVEKPIALSLADADAMLVLASTHNVVLGVNHNFTQAPAVRQLRAHIEALHLGRVDHVALMHHVPIRQLDTGDAGHFMFQAEANILLEQGVHVFSMVHDLLGECRVTAAAPMDPRTLGNGVRFFTRWQFQILGERGTAGVTMAFGRTLTETTLQVIGTDGAAFVDLQRGVCWLRRKTRWPDFMDHARNLAAGGLHLLRRACGTVLGYSLALFKLSFPDDPFLRSMRQSIASFHASIKLALPLRNSGQAGRAVLKMCLDAAVVANASLQPPAPFFLPPLLPPRPGEVVLLGGGGMIGRRCVKQLLQRQRPVTILVRRPSLLPAELRQPHIRLVVGDAADADVLQRAFAGADAVLHLATAGGDDPANVEQSMASAVKTAALVARACKVRRLVYASSVAALWLGQRGKADCEVGPDPRPQHRAPYARGKVAAERELAAQRALGLETCVVRPAIVLSADTSPTHSGVGFWVRDNQCVGFGRGRTPLPLLLADDCASALVAALDAPNAANRSYNIAGPVRPTAREFVRTLRVRSGRDYRFYGQPVWFLFGVEIGKYLVKVLACRPREFPSLRDLRSRNFLTQLDCERAQQDLGWQPEVDAVSFYDRALGTLGPRG
ncbi:hypothetical protein LBMAG49_13740 [Planctomycetota bacterium]|nr:Gfo/Idh/MocA family oxidoreductase [Planctomycetota bacterium]GDY02045.1 hypothetical protein LBMAG49_13740 [Planctomycetota bacterium]